jgi:AAA15 family ATPase/GTPase
MSLINNIEINNFKSIRNLKLENCNKINLLVGPPNVGKSNILEALAVTGLNIADLCKNINDFVRFNGFYDLINQGNENKAIEIFINECKYSIAEVGNTQLNNLEIKYRISKFYNEENPNSSFYFGINEKKEIKEYGKNPDVKFEDIQYYKFKNEIVFENTISKTLEKPSGQNLGTTILHYTELQKIIQNYLGKTKEELIISIDDNSVREPKISFALSDILKIERNYNLLSDTLKRIIFHLAAIYSNSNTTLLFEEPEAHCYEPYMIDFTNAISANENQNQYFIVTHSDYIIQEFLREAENRKNVNIYLINNIGYGTDAKLLSANEHEEVYKYGKNIFFNFHKLWEGND